MLLETEVFTKIVFASHGVIDNFRRCALEYDLAIVDETGAVNDRQGFTHRVVGDQDRKTVLVAQIANNALDVFDLKIC